MDSIEIVDNCNQTLFEIYDSYFQGYKQIFGYHLTKVREECVDYFNQNAQKLGIGFLIYVVFSFCFYCFIIRTKLVRNLGTINNCKNILFVISHPDDECMFFGPTIITLATKPNCSVYLLCLSRGNYKKLGRIRKEELFASCKILGIPEGNIQIMNSSLLPDNPKVNWNQEIVAEIILNFVETYSIDTVLTFDKYGVSNHLNHSSIFYAMAYLCLEKNFLKGAQPML